eukprot:ctg_673.g430
MVTARARIRDVPGKGGDVAGKRVTSRVSPRESFYPSPDKPVTPPILAMKNVSLGDEQVADGGVLGGVGAAGLDRDDVKVYAVKVETVQHLQLGALDVQTEIVDVEPAVRVALKRSGCRPRGGGRNKSGGKSPRS